MKRIFCCLLSLVVIACNNTSTTIVSADTATIGYSDSATQVADSTQAKAGLDYKVDTSSYVTKTLLQPRDTIVTVDLNNGKGSVTAYISGIGKHVTVVVPITGGDSIMAELVPESDTANIRFKQIYIPVGKQGKYDGPFSRTIKYPITVKGNYRLIISENLMTGTNWKGSFTCNVMVK